MTNAAPIGKRCDRCHCCDALLVTEGEALCAACDDGTHPTLSDVLSTPPNPDSVPETPLAIPVPEPERKDALAVRMRRGSRRRISLELARTILDADPRIPANVLARVFGIAAKSVRKIRNNAQAIPMPATDDLGPVPELVLEIRRASTNHLTVSESTMDAWWETLSKDDKAALLSANYRFRIERSAL